MKRAGNVARENLLSFGTVFGKFTKTGKFRLHITALDYLAPYAKVGVDLQEWITVTVKTFGLLPDQGRIWLDFVDFKYDIK